MNLSRRQQVSTLGAGGLLAQAPAAARLGVIGLGNRSRAHFAAFKQLPEARVTALCDLDSQQIGRVNQQTRAVSAVPPEFQNGARVRQSLRIFASGVTIRGAKPVTAADFR